MEAMKAPAAAGIGPAEAEDMCDYLQRMNKQLEEMAAQHMQTMPPRRESLARATALYLERKATSEAGTPTGQGRAASTGGTPSLSTPPSGRRHTSSSSTGIMPIPLMQPRVAGNNSRSSSNSGAQLTDGAAARNARKLFKHASEAGTCTGSADAAAAEVDCEDLEGVPDGSICSTPPKMASFTEQQHQQHQQLDDWQPMSEQPLRAVARRGQQQQQEPHSFLSRIAVFHSPQNSRQSSVRRGSDPDSSRGSLKSTKASLAAAFDAAAAPPAPAAAAAAAPVSGRLADSGRSAGKPRGKSETGTESTTAAAAGAGGSRAGSCNWQQSGPAGTPEKAGQGKSVLKPPRGRSFTSSGRSTQPTGAQQIHHSKSAGALSATVAAVGGGCGSGGGFNGSTSSSRSASAGRSSSGCGSGGGGNGSNSRRISRTSSHASRRDASDDGAGAVEPIQSSPFRTAGAAQQPTALLDDDDDVFAAVETAIDAAAAAVNNMTSDLIIAASCSARRLSTDSSRTASWHQLANDRDSSFKGSVSRRTSSNGLKAAGVAAGAAAPASDVTGSAGAIVTAAAGDANHNQWALQEASPLEALALEVMQEQDGLLHKIPEQQQQQQQQNPPAQQDGPCKQQQLVEGQPEEQQQQQLPPDKPPQQICVAEQSAVEVKYSIMDLGQSEFVCQGSVDEDFLAWIEETTAVCTQAEAAAANPGAAACAAVTAESQCASLDADATGADAVETEDSACDCSTEASAVELVAAEASMQSCMAVDAIAAKWPAAEEITVGFTGHMPRAQNAAAAAAAAAEEDTRPELLLAEPAVPGRHVAEASAAMCTAEAAAAPDLAAVEAAESYMDALLAADVDLQAAEEGGGRKSTATEQLAAAEGVEAAAEGWLAEASTVEVAAAEAAERDGIGPSTELPAADPAGFMVEASTTDVADTEDCMASVADAQPAAGRQHMAEESSATEAAAEDDDMHEAATVSAAAAEDPGAAAHQQQPAAAAAVEEEMAAEQQPAHPFDLLQDQQNQEGPCGVCGSYSCSCFHPVEQPEAEQNGIQLPGLSSPMPSPLLQRQQPGHMKTGSHSLLVPAFPQQQLEDLPLHQLSQVLSSRSSSSTCGGTSRSRSSTGSGRCSAANSHSTGLLPGISCVDRQHHAAEAEQHDAAAAAVAVQAAAAVAATVELQGGTVVTEPGIAGNADVCNDATSADSTSCCDRYQPLIAVETLVTAGCDDLVLFASPMGSPCSSLAHLQLARLGHLRLGSTRLSRDSATGAADTPTAVAGTPAKGAVAAAVLQWESLQTADAIEDCLEQPPSPSAAAEAAPEVPPAAGAITASPKQHWRHRECSMHLLDQQAAGVDATAREELFAGLPSHNSASTASHALEDTDAACAPSVDETQSHPALAAAATAAPVSVPLKPGIGKSFEIFSSFSRSSFGSLQQSQDLPQIGTPPDTGAAGARAAADAAATAVNVANSSCLEDVSVHNSGCLEGTEVHDEAALLPEAPQSEQQYREEVQHDQQQPTEQLDAEASGADTAPAMETPHEPIRDMQLVAAAASAGACGLDASLDVMAAEGSEEIFVVGRSLQVSPAPAHQTDPQHSSSTPAAAAGLDASLDAMTAEGSEEIVVVGRPLQVSPAPAHQTDPQHSSTMPGHMLAPDASDKLQQAQDTRCPCSSSVDAGDDADAETDLDWGHIEQAQLQPEQPLRGQPRPQHERPVPLEGVNSPVGEAQHSGRAEASSCIQQGASNSGGSIGQQLQQQQLQQQLDCVAMLHNPQQQQHCCEQQHGQRHAHPNTSRGFQGCAAAAGPPVKSPHKPSWGARMLGQITSALCRQGCELVSLIEQQDQLGPAEDSSIPVRAALLAQAIAADASSSCHSSTSMTVTPAAADVAAPTAMGASAEAATDPAPCNAAVAAARLLLQATAAERAARLPDSSSGSSSQSGNTVLSPAAAASAILVHESRQQQQQLVWQPNTVEAAHAGEADCSAAVNDDVVEPASGPVQRVEAHVPQLAVATAVSVAGVGLAASLGTPSPHLVSCGSILHAPTLAAVSLLLTASSLSHRRSSRSGSGSNSEAFDGSDEDRKALAAAAAGLAVFAAAIVAKWELECTQYPEDFEAEASQSSQVGSTAQAEAEAEAAEVQGSQPAGPSACARAASDEYTLVTPGEVSVGDFRPSQDAGEDEAHSYSCQQEDEAHQDEVDSEQQQQQEQHSQQQQQASWQDDEVETEEDEEGDDEHVQHLPLPPLPQPQQWDSDSPVVLPPLVHSIYEAVPAEVAGCSQYQLSISSTTSAAAAAAADQQLQQQWRKVEEQDVPQAEEILQSFVAEQNSYSSCAAAAAVPEESTMTGLPELVQDESRLQPMRPAVYDAARYEEPTSPQASAVEATTASNRSSCSSERASSRGSQHHSTAGEPSAGQQQQPMQDASQQPAVQQPMLVQCLANQGASSGHTLQQRQRWQGAVPHTDEHCPQQQQQQQQLSHMDVVQQETVASSQHQQQYQQQQQQHSMLQAQDIGAGCSASSSDAGSGFTRKALQAVQQLRLLRLQNRAAGGAGSASSSSNEAATAHAVRGLAVAAQPMPASPLQQQQQQQQLGMLPKDLCLGHGLLGEQQPCEQQQQLTGQGQQPGQEQQNKEQPPTGLSLSEYYRMLLQQQEQQQQTTAGAAATPVSCHSSISSDTASKPEQDTTSGPAGCVASSSSSGRVGALVPGPGTTTAANKQHAALAKLKQGMLMRSQRMYKSEPSPGFAAAAGAPQGLCGDAGSDQLYEEAVQVDMAQKSNTQTANRIQQQQHSGSRVAWPDSSCQSGAMQAGGDDGDLDGSSGGEQSAAPKPFLKRRSQQVMGRKLDWSNVQSRTQTRLDTRYVPPSKDRRQLLPSAATRGTGSSASNNNNSNSSSRQRPQQPWSASSATYDPALAAARARAGLMNPSAGGSRSAAAGSSRSRAKTRSSNPYAGYEPGYEVEIHSSTYYRARPTSSGSSSSNKQQKAATGVGAAAAADWDSAGGAGAVGKLSAGAVRAAGVGQQRSSAPWLTAFGTDTVQSASSYGGSSSSRLAFGVPGDDAADGLGPLHSEFSITDSRGGAGGSSASSRRVTAAPVEAPLDDLLQHVNHLIKEFDRMYDQ